MMQLNTAQRMNAAFLGVDPDFYNAETAQVAVEQTRQLIAYAKAPHANRPTPPRPKFQRKPRLVYSKAHEAMIEVPRLFKGHRP